MELNSSGGVSLFCNDDLVSIVLMGELFSRIGFGSQPSLVSKLLQFLYNLSRNIFSIASLMSTTSLYRTVVCYHGLPNLLLYHC